MEFMDFNNPFEPKAFHTFEYVQVHVMNLILKAAVIVVCLRAAYLYDMSFTQGSVITLVALLLECLIYRKMYTWKRDNSSSYAVNELVAYLLGLTAWGILTLVLYVFGYENTIIRVLSLFIILVFSFSYKTIELKNDLDAISPFYHYELGGRVVSSAIYASIILSLGILLSVLLSAPEVFNIFLAISVLVIPLYIVLVRPHYTDDFLTNKKIIYRIPFIEKRLIKKLLQDYLKEQKLSDTEYAVIDEYPDLFSEYFRIQYILNECLAVFLSGKYSRHYLRGILKNLEEHASFYEKLHETTENYVKQKKAEEEEENKRREEQAYRNRKNAENSGQYQNEQRLQFFKNVTSIDELNKEFRKLVKKFHPDSPNGDQRTFIAMTEEYEHLKELLNYA